MLKKLIFAIFPLMLNACAGAPANESAQKIAPNMQYQEVTANGFAIATYRKINDASQATHVYIEGDGRAWINAHEPANDPTPHVPLALQLAVQDDAANVLYLARPCQYTLVRSPACNVRYWTDKRFAPEVIETMSVVLSQIKVEFALQKIDLIGYSGGAAVAVLIAARRDDVQSLRSVAGNLDHVFVNAYHHVDAMPESLNALNVADKIAHIPQLHFVGDVDKIIPAQVAAGFVAGQAHQHCAHIVQVKAGHAQGWQAQWPALLRIPIKCEN